jgi:cystathionine beta-lyase/cystathionine gamma-synthase
MIGGFVATNDPTVAERLYFLQKSLGAILGPMDCWLVLRGVKTLAIRMQKHSENARRVAEYLAEHEAVESVLPGLPGHPHEIAAPVATSANGLVCSPRDKSSCRATKIFKLAEGSAPELIEHLARMVGLHRRRAVRGRRTRSACPRDQSGRPDRGSRTGARRSPGRSFL